MTVMTDATESFTGLMVERLAPWLTPQLDPEGAHQIMVEARAAMGEQLFSLVWDQGDPEDPDYQPGWGSLFDVDACPTQFLPFLAQLVGVTLPAGLSDLTWRDMIRNEQGMQRGTPGIITATAKRFLTGTQYVNLLERQNLTGAAPYAFVVVVKATEVSRGQTWATETLPWNAASGTWSGTDQTVALTTAINRVKPAGVNWSLAEVSGHYWSSATKTWSAETIQWRQADINTI